MLERGLDIRTTDARMIREHQRAELFGIGDHAPLVVGFGNEANPKPVLAIREGADLAMRLVFGLEGPNPWQATLPFRRSLSGGRGRSRGARGRRVGGGHRPPALARLQGEPNRLHGGV